MKKTRYYFEIGGYYNENCDWGYVCSAAAKEGIRLYEDKSTNEIYSYDDISKHTLSTGMYVWEFKLLRCEEVEIEPTVTKLPSHNKYKNGYNWKAHKKAMNPSLQKPKSRTIEEEKKKNDLLWVEYKNTRQARLNKKSKKKRSDS